MTAIKRSRTALLSLTLAVASLLGVFAIIDASSANASQVEIISSTINFQPDIIISPSELQASLYPDELLTQTLWITNTSSDPITFTIYEAVYAALGNPPYTDLPWLSETLYTGTLSVGEGIQIDVTFDSTALVPGAYHGALGILSNDATQPFTLVPVSLDVLSEPNPVIAVDPQSFSANLNAGELQTDTLTIRNDGDAVLDFSLYEISRTHNLQNPPVDLSIPDPYPMITSVQVDPNVRTQLLFLGKSRLILYLRGGMDFSAANRYTDKADRGQYVYDQLVDLASRSSDLFEWLQSQGAQPQRLLTVNAIAATLNSAQLADAINFPQVGRISTNRYFAILHDTTRTFPSVINSANSPATVEWNIAKIRADETWSTFGITGQGAVVGEVDTGVMYNHAALVSQYRGNLGDGVFDHNYNWFDFVGGQPTPYDDVGHGTMGMGVAVGGDGGVNQIGVAPGAKWIAVKACGNGLSCSEADLYAAADWMLAPTRLDGTEPDPTKAPQLVLNMWGGGSCDDWFQTPILVLRAAGILPVFAPGGSGPGCSTIASPADSPDVLSAGATDINDNIAQFSARGPSCYGEVKPDLSAPGVDIRSSYNNGDYTVMDGTSWSAAHAAGAAAMVFSANPLLGPTEVEDTLYTTAFCRQNLACGGEACPGPNNVYGYGRIDVFEAVSATIGSRIDIPWLTAGPITGELQPGEAFTTSVEINASGLQPGIYRAGIAIESNDPQALFITLPVTLTVSEPCQSITDMTAIFTPLDPWVGESITFTASASGTIPISYRWNFYDGSTAMGAQVTHAFSNPGIHIVSLEAENACTEPVMIAINVPVQAILQKYMLPLVTK